MGKISLCSAGCCSDLDRGYQWPTRTAFSLLEWYQGSATGGQVGGGGVCEGGGVVSNKKVHKFILNVRIKKGLFIVI